MRAQRFTLVLIGVLLAIHTSVQADHTKVPVPESADFMVAITSIERLHDIFGVAALRAQYPDKFAAMAKEGIDEVGMDFFDIEALRQLGIHVDSPLYIAAFTDPDIFCLMLPGEKSVLEAILEYDTKNTGPMTMQERGGRDVHLNADGRSALFMEKDYVVVVVADSGSTVNLVEWVDKFASDAPRLSDDKKFKELSKHLKGKGDIYFYIGPDMHSSKWGRGSGIENVTSTLPDDEVEQALRDLGADDSAAGYAITLGESTISAEGYAYYGKDCAFLGWFPENDPVPFFEKFGADPWLLMAMRVNLAAAWESLYPIFKRSEKYKDTLNEKIAAFKTETNIDFEKEIIAQLDGNIGLSVEQIGMAENNLAVFVQVRDEALARTTVATVVDSMQASVKNPAMNQIMEEESGGIPFYTIIAPMAGPISFGVVDGHIVVAPRPVFVSIIQETGGLLNTMTRAPVVELLKNRNSSVFYLDFAGLSRDLMPMAPLMGEDATPFMELLGKLDYTSFGAMRTEDGIRHDGILVAREAGVWQALLSYMLGLEKPVPEDG